MDLLDFEGQDLYFDKPQHPEIDALILKSSALYAEDGGELPLLEACALEPESLTVLVALYRFYYYQHRLEDALEVSRRVLAITGRDLGFPPDWQALQTGHVEQAITQSMTLLRFHLLCLKAAAFVQLRLGRLETGKSMLQKLVALDSNNRLGAQQLLDVLDIAEENDTIPKPLKC
ncbi:hypothetical protein F6R98_03685 [Candidatus Methylospira mobilis]|uniref:Tetratricopeptide repeat protein n=1 Tax=Candidatus Methylospira mobilis TaxID=1808979 RepID=A0A5Q0BFD5_9GAMM|nr:hypothetical protein [Candidatus Methylospira mobilis]QFY41842.1 hypothetical protein F6R98_03685 [Candidatus Methylospira mobilis]WNV06711.1 hypothetical protein RP726_09980 [Candidatus Methylospira mobilis]